MRGRIADAEDAVQEAFSRLMSADIDTIDDVRGWLIVVVSRISLDQLRSATARREIPAMSEISTEMGATTDPADRITLEDSVRLAMLVVLERLTPVDGSSSCCTMSSPMVSLPTGRATHTRHVSRFGAGPHCARHTAIWDPLVNSRTPCVERCLALCWLTRGVLDARRTPSGRASWMTD